MTLLVRYLPNRIALNAELEEESGEEETELDSGIIVTNQRWAAIRRTFSFSLPPMKASDPDLIELRDLWRTARRSDSFYMDDYTGGDGGVSVKVKFAADLTIVAMGNGIFAVNGLRLVEAKEA